MFGIKKYKLSKDNRNALLIDLNRTIEINSEQTVDLIVNKKYKNIITFPCNKELSNEEKIAIKELSKIPNIKSALKKIIIDASSFPVFDLLSLIDWIRDIEDIEWWKWVSLVDNLRDKFEEWEMLHDWLYEKYYDWIKIKNRI